MYKYQHLLSPCIHFSASFGKDLSLVSDLILILHLDGMDKKNQPENE